ncbi:peptidoglycan-binding protein [Nostocaceae cyanobacterium CENA357]|uniref:Peptidoglycan-binding protein n=1 Tax=Atlanticothrix silvestris CENA357 TaxID=1725252 RepID=A0A8J7L5N8_9CYAN|nr:peptidoglycan-binding protein [Atlanticothrix silvestris]MBH8554867.1 peptidoglycan-binding protein [Atlanticothrix silvestris CENA357]
MDTLAYLHLAETYEASANSEQGTVADFDLCFPELNWTKDQSKALMLLFSFNVGLGFFNCSNPALALRKGNKSSQVISLQQKLKAAGYFGESITGYFGPVTEAAVIKFQKANGLIADGIVGSQTLSALTSDLGTPKSSSPLITDDQKKLTATTATLLLQRGNSSSQVTSLQQKLYAVGYFKEPITGQFDAATQAAVIRFQKANKLVIDGIVGPKTLSALESSSTILTPPVSQSTSPSAAIASKPQQLENQEQQKHSQKTVSSHQTQKIPTPAVSQSIFPSAAIANKPQQLEKQDQQKHSQKTVSSHQTQKMTLTKTISGRISPKSVVYSGNGLFFAQNMMYNHTITVYNREHELVKVIPDEVNLSKYGYSKFKGTYKGAPVEASFSHNGKYAWVSNYKMYGKGFNKPGSDQCNPSQKTDKSFLYRINTDTLDIDNVIQVGSVPKFVATSPDQRLVLVSNWCSWDLSIVDTEKNQEIKRIKLGAYPRGIVVDAASEKAYIAVMGSYEIAEVDLRNFSVKWLKNIGRSPRHLNIDPADKYLYASLNGEGKIAKISLPNGKLIKKISTGNAPRSMVLSDNGQRLYVVNYSDNTVSKIRTNDMKIIQKVNVGANPIGITYDPETKQVWVACYSGNIMVFQD